MLRVPRTFRLSGSRGAAVAPDVQLDLTGVRQNYSHCRDDAGVSNF